MTQDEKELLLKDLCARLPYEVKCLVNFDDGTKEIMTLKTGLPNSFGRWDFYNENCSGCSNTFKPYLRPMSSMTTEEKDDYDNLLMSIGDGCENTDYMPDNCMKYVDWLNKHHFDYRGLIDKGLALEAPEDMYKNI